MCRASSFRFRPVGFHSVPYQGNGREGRVAQAWTGYLWQCCLYEQPVHGFYFPECIVRVNRGQLYYYQSQVHINIECCFDMLTQRWGGLALEGVLRKPLQSKNMEINKVVGIVSALCRLHSFCINDAIHGICERQFTNIEGNVCGRE